MRVGGVLALLAALIPVAMATEAPTDVRYADGRLSLHVEGAPLEQVIESIRQATGLEFRGELRDWRAVHKHFEAVPLAEALDRILGNQNFILRYAANGHPTAVELQGLALPRGKPSRSQPQAEVLRLLSTAPPVPLSGSLRAALRTGTARPAQLLLAGVNQPQASVREEARKAFLNAVSANRPLRDALVRADAKALVPLVRPLPADRAEELLADLGRRSGDPVLRGFFLRLRARLRKANTAGGRG